MSAPSTPEVNTASFRRILRFRIINLRLLAHALHLTSDLEGHQDLRPTRLPPQGNVDLPAVEEVIE